MENTLVEDQIQSKDEEDSYQSTHEKYSGMCKLEETHHYFFLFFLGTRKTLYFVHL